ncbi:ROK family transcriptional regulator [Allosphingosinicella deserti]|uniref:Sugar kinase n=1 Tax=Allosphingosinicella deserti TaxID=2116704 RepID=A0A2P7QRP2_9SPHN|nr:ROK family transcriptional regulator [Sphingomonas deserti]PSJ40635.1 sugar kinase [Sphingomonas deserti]
MIDTDSSAPSRLSGTNLERTADHNQRVTLHAIRVAGPCTRAELAEITGLTGPTVANITRRLQADGLIAVAGKRIGLRGQPAIQFKIREDACYAIGLSVDADEGCIVLIDFAGAILALRREPLPGLTVDHVRAFYHQSIGGLLRSGGVGREKILGLGLALPDPGAGTLPDWDGVDMAAMFAAPFPVPVFSDDAAAAAAMGEGLLGLGQTYGSFFYLLIGPRLRGGLVIDGSFVRRDGGQGLEIAPTGSGAGLAAVREGGAPVSFARLSEELEQHGLFLKDLKHGGSYSAEVEECLRGWTEQAASRLATVLEPINCLLNPAAVLLGGKAPEFVFDRLAAKASDLLKQKAAQIPAIAPIVRAAFAHEAIALGAAILPMHHYLLPKSGTLWKTPTDREPARHPKGQ